MMKHKKLTLVVMIMILLTFTGCAQINIDTGVDNDYNAYIIYQIEVDVSLVEPAQMMSTIDALDTVMEHYESKLGFEVLENKTDFLQGVCRYEFAKKVPHDNYEEAFNTLQDMLTDENITPFMQVDMTSKITEYQQLYSFKGGLDFETIYITTNIKGFPQYMQDTIDQNFKDSKGAVSISLPGTEIENAVGGEATVNDGQISMTVPFELSQKTALELSTRLTANGEEILHVPMNRVLQNLSLSLRFWVAMGIVAFAGIIVGVVWHVRKGKNKEVDSVQIDSVTTDTISTATVKPDDAKIDT